jgi:hypothetical protein
VGEKGYLGKAAVEFCVFTVLFFIAKPIKIVRLMMTVERWSVGAYTLLTFLLSFGCLASIIGAYVWYRIRRRRQGRGLISLGMLGGVLFLFLLPFLFSPPAHRSAESTKPPVALGLERGKDSPVYGSAPDLGGSVGGEAESSGTGSAERDSGSQGSVDSDNDSWAGSDTDSGSWASTDTDSGAWDGGGDSGGDSGGGDSGGDSGGDGGGGDD